MAINIKYYTENGVTILEEGSSAYCFRPSFYYNSVNDTVTIINLDNQAQDWSGLSSEFRDKNGSSIGTTESEIVTYLSENTIFSKSSFPKGDFSLLVSDMFKGRVEFDGGTFEAKQCFIDNLQDLS